MFTAAYNFFAQETVLPMLVITYPGATIPHKFQLTLMVSNLAGSFTGQLTFGYLADLFGRKSLFGISLLLTLLSALGAATSSSGNQESMRIIGWLIFWRLVSGFGAGALIPLSATITSEFAPRRHRPRMLATVSSMQPISGLVGVSLLLAVLFSSRNETSHGSGACYRGCIRSVDSDWRLIVGLGTVPAAIALVFQFTMPESPRYMVQVPSQRSIALRDFQSQSEHEDGDDLSTSRPARETDLRLHSRNFYKAARTYFIVQKNYNLLLGTSAPWFLIAFIVSVFGINPSGFYRTIYESRDQSPESNVYDFLFSNSLRYLVLISLGTTAGGLLMIKSINHVSPMVTQRWAFIFIGTLFLIILGSFATALSNAKTVLIILSVLCHVTFGLGPSLTTFIVRF